MAQAYEDFSGATLDALPAGFSLPWGVLEASVKPGSAIPGLTRHLRISPLGTVGSFERGVLEWSALPTSGVTTVRVRLRVVFSDNYPGSFETQNILGPMVSGSGTSTSRTGYASFQSQEVNRIERMDSGSTSTLNSNVRSPSLLVNGYADVNIEIIRNGSTIESRAWTDSQARPAKADISATDEFPLTVAGFLGLLVIPKNAGVRAVELYEIQAANDGDALPGPPARTLTNYADTFVAANGSRLDAHTADSGETYGTNASFLIENEAVYSTGSSQQILKVLEADNVTDYVSPSEFDFEFIYNRLTDLGNVGYILCATDENNGYYLRVIIGEKIDLFSRVAGSFTPLYSGTGQELVTNSSRISLEVRAAGLTLFIDGVQVHTNTNTDHSRAGGLFLRFFDGVFANTGYHLKSAQVITQTVPDAAPDAAPVIGTLVTSSNSVSGSFTFDETANTGDPATYYEVRVNGGAWQAADAAGMDFTVTGLQANTTYNTPGVEMRAGNSGGTGPLSTAVAFTTDSMVATPVNLAATEITNTSAKLTWSRG